MRSERRCKRRGGEWRRPDRGEIRKEMQEERRRPDRGEIRKEMQEERRRVEETRQR